MISPGLRPGVHPSRISTVSLGYELYRLADGQLHRLARVEMGNLFAVHPASAWPKRLSSLGVLG